MTIIRDILIIDKVDRQFLYRFVISNNDTSMSLSNFKLMLVALKTYVKNELEFEKGFNITEDSWEELDWSKIGAFKEDINNIISIINKGCSNEDNQIYGIFNCIGYSDNKYALDFNSGNVNIINIKLD